MSDPKNNQPPLGESIGEIVDRTTALVHEEIELAKAEVAVSLQNLLRGSVAAIVGGVFAFFGLFILLIAISFLISDAISYGDWPGFFVVAFVLFLGGGLLAFTALKKIKKGSQLVPTQAIEEAKKTQAALTHEGARDVQRIDSVAVEEPAALQHPDVREQTVATPAKPAPETVEPSASASATADRAAAAEQITPAPVFVTDLPTDDAAGVAKDSAEATEGGEKAEKLAAEEDAKAAKQAAKEAGKNGGDSTSAEVSDDTSKPYDPKRES